MVQTDRTIARILKVNHAGEYGAIRIYRAQLWMARHLYPDIVDFLETTLEHEIRHCSAFHQAMPRWSARPCRIMALWGNGGWVLGFVTALIGRNSIWICTAAVEAAVHRHLEDQLLFLHDKASDLHQLISDIQLEEQEHLRYAKQRISHHGFWVEFLTWTITLSTEIAIWLSTWGESTRMTQTLKRQATDLKESAVAE